MYLKLTKLTYGSSSADPTMEVKTWESPVIVNTDTITYLEVNEKGTKVNFVNGNTVLTVKETDELLSKLNY